VLTNGGFETGDFGGWTHGGALAHRVVSDPKHSGAYAARLGNPAYACDGGVPPDSAAWMVQTVRVPDTTNPQLSFWRRIYSQDNATWDYLRVVVRDTSGHEREELMREGAPPPGGDCETTWDSGWQHRTFSLAAYRGQQVQLYFENRVTDTEGWYNTWSIVDDVEISR